jgi:hypothetical protein
MVLSYVTPGSTAALLGNKLAEIRRSPDDPPTEAAILR